MSVFFGSSDTPPRDQTFVVACYRHPYRDLTNTKRHWSCTACSWVQLAVEQGLALGSGKLKLTHARKVGA